MLIIQNKVALLVMVISKYRGMEIFFTQKSEIFLLTTLSPSWQNCLLRLYISDKCPLLLISSTKQTQILLGSETENCLSVCFKTINHIDAATEEATSTSTS